jgi:iron uptake system component EfeO
VAGARQVAVVVGAGALAALAAGCGGAGAGSPADAGSAGNAASGGGQTLKVTLTDEGCSPAKLEARAGSVTFEVRSGGTSRVTEFELKNANGIILGERENIVAGIGGSFTLKLQPGRYVLSCPNGDISDNGALVVSGNVTPDGSAPSAALLATATAGYRSYIVREVDLLLTGTRRFVAAVTVGEAARARQLFGPVRRHYEAIEPVAESFGDLDPEIDARVNDVADQAEWTGFHRLEQILWQRGTTAGAERDARKLLADVTALNRRVRTLDLQPAQLANGAVELLNEVARSKITGEEDRYSHTDLSDFQGNLTGARTAFDLLRPALVEQGRAQLAARIDERFAAVQRGLDRYRRSTPLGFALYGELTPADRRAFAQQVDALAEPLSTVAGAVSQ